ncbi:hypothetical protein ACS5NO_27530 [Larkinella sp. GY13]|uniref:hypothetical protein n=1 Tax=Larkinella sp. GY13 TaxID=3453720 RepID=UPI003EEACB7E
MKTLLLFLLVTLTFTACKKDDNEVAPAKPAEAVAGTYNLKSFYYVSGDDRINLPTLPYTQNGQTVSGTASLTPQTTDDQVTLRLTLKITGSDDQSIELKNLTVQQNGSGYDLTAGNQTIASSDGKKMNLAISETDPTTKETSELKFTAEK